MKVGSLCEGDLYKLDDDLDTVYMANTQYKDFMTATAVMFKNSLDENQWRFFARHSKVQHSLVRTCNRVSTIILVMEE